MHFKARELTAIALLAAVFVAAGLRLPLYARDGGASGPVGEVSQSHGMRRDDLQLDSRPDPESRAMGPASSDRHLQNRTLAGPKKDLGRWLDIDGPVADTGARGASRSIGEFIPVGSDEREAGPGRSRSIGRPLDPDETVSGFSRTGPVDIGGFINVDVYGHGLSSPGTGPIERGVYIPVSTR